MLKKTAVAGLIVLTLSGCSQSGSDVDESRTTEALGSAIDYGQGFLTQESNPDGSTFRWMGSEGAIRLRNTHRDMVLAVKGRAPLTAGRLPTIGFEFNGESLDPIVGARGDVQKRFEIPVTKQGADDWCTLRITTNKTFVPHEIDPKSPDQRRLGFALYELSWEPK